MDRRKKLGFLLDPFSRPFKWFREFEETPRLGAAEPSIDVFETNGEVIATVELPGVEKEDIKIRVTEDGMHLKIEKREKTEKEKKEPGFYAYSYAARFGGYSEWITFPASVEAAKAKATFKNGVLEVRMPKTAAKEGKKVEIT